MVLHQDVEKGGPWQLGRFWPNLRKRICIREADCTGKAVILHLQGKPKTYATGFGGHKMAAIAHPDVSDDIPIHPCFFLDTDEATVLPFCQEATENHAIERIFSFALLPTLLHNVDG